MIKPRTALMLTVVFLAASMFLVNPEVSAITSTISPALPATSVISKVPDFYADGQSGSYILHLSAKGGYLDSGPYRMPLMPWGYVTTKWTVGTVYIIFLANVTTTDFTIAFLYLTNSTDPFILRIYKYAYNSVDLITFDGSETVYRRMVATSSVSMPKLKIQAQAQTLSNTLNAIGPGIYLAGSYGQIISDSASNTIFPLRNQYFQESDAYNELWTLLADQSGGYYFGILYMRNNDTSHVILEHQLRLNDYQAISGRTFNAKWARSFGGVITLRLPTSNTTVVIDGFPFQTNEKGIASANVPIGSAAVQVPNEITSSGGSRLRFTSWDRFGSANPLYVTLNASLDLTANYTTEYKLAVQSDYGKPQGEGWYIAGTNASFSVPTQVTYDNGTQRIFKHWGQDYGTTLSQGWIIMNSPKIVQAYFVTQFKVNLQLQGTPPNSTVNLTLNGKPLQVRDLHGAELWADQNSQLAIQVRTIQLQDAAVNYNFTDILVNGGRADANIRVAKPINIALVYSAHPKTTSSIDLKVDPTSGVEGYPLTIVGSVAPKGGSANVRLSYSTDNTNWERIAETTVGSDGRFTYAWTANAAGTYFIKAFWPGDEQYTATSRVVSVKITQAPFSNLGNSNELSEIVETLMNNVRSVPVLATVIGLASSLLMFGFVMGAAIAPNNAPLIGYMIGSLIVGFVFIFPISTLILTVKAAKSHRAPSLLWLTPLMTIWLVALGMVIMGMFVISPPLNVAAGVLLVSSNALMFPLTLSLLVAKSVVG